MNRYAGWAALLLPWFLSSAAHAVELMQWDRVPLAVPLTVGQERLLYVDQDVRVGVPGAIATKLRVQSIGGTVYLLAAEAIGPTRLQLQAVDTGSIILVDIEAQPGDQALEPVQITTHSVATDQAVDGEQVRSAPPTPLPVALTRYAAQNLYAPLRTVESLPGVRRTPLKVGQDLRHLLPDESVVISPMAAWRHSDFWVTVVKLRNLGARAIQLDPRRLQATLYSATFQHTFLGSHGTPEDTTVAYLVTRGAGLEKAMLLLPLPAKGDGHEE